MRKWRFYADEKRTSNWTKCGNQDYSTVGMDAGGNCALQRTVFLQCDGGSAIERPAGVGPAFAWASACPGGGLLSAVPRLYKPRRETPRHEPDALDHCGHSYSQRFGHPSLFRPPAAAALRLPTMRERGSDGIQLLPSLQLQTEPKLPAMPARDQRERRVLPTLRDVSAQSSDSGLRHSNRASRLTTNAVTKAFLIPAA
jgi:hypothetical protein